MKRLRQVFVILALLLWLPLLGLVLFAVRTVNAEEAGRYQALGERIFDEMERELTTLLNREERRPADAYDPSQGLLALGQATDSFILGYFERSGSGELRHTPWQGDEAIARALVAEPTGAGSLVSSGTPEQAPGSTWEPAQRTASKRYDSLSQLNRGAATRETGVTDVLSLGLLRARSSGSVLRNEPLFAPHQTATPEPEPPTTPTSTKPFQVRYPDPQHVLLFRAATRNGENVTQGLVLDLPDLLHFLSSRVMTEDGALARAAHLSLLTGQAQSRAQHSYQHRFGEPLSGVSALLVLDRLEELDANGYTSGISALLLLLGAASLFAGYRMVGTVVAYAERRNDFVSAVTHELKTPLTAIRMYGEMLRDDVVPDPAKRGRYYRIITAESERLTRLIDNVLELARLERGQRAVSLSMGDVSGVVRDTLEVLEPHATELGFTLRFESEPKLPAVPFDRDALSQVLFNLVDNALKYSSEASERTVTVRCQRQGIGVALSVQDHGPGVAQEHLRFIWQPFFRGERELTRKHKGTGIGLALVRGLVERMGGQVTGRNTEPGFEVRVTLGTAQAGSAL